MNPLKKLTALIATLMPGCAPAETVLQGDASFYAQHYIGKTMANGQPYRADALTMANWELPLGTWCRVEYVSARGNTRSVVVQVTDRGPAHRLVAEGRLFDLSWAAFRALENPRVGIISVKVVVLDNNGGQR